MSLIGRLKCRLLGQHDWNHRPGAIPSDRETFRCSRCDEWGFSPSMVTETDVPSDVVEAATEGE